MSSAASSRRYLTTEIPMDVWAELALQLLEVRDLQKIGEDVWPGLPAGAVYVARHILNHSAQVWFAKRGVPVQLHAAHNTITGPEDDLCSWYSLPKPYLFDVYSPRSYFPIQVWLLNGRLHRDNDLPAVERCDGTRTWCNHGQTHRDNDLPAVVQEAIGTYTWCVHGKMHRDGGLPAVEHANGDREWWFRGKRHRDGGLPAYVCQDSRRWYVHGVMCRAGDLPASECANGDREWWIDGTLHRDNDLPAIERANGDREWFIRGERYRENDLPIIERGNGDREWLSTNGVRHRDNDQPAVVRANGDCEWWVHGMLVRAGGRAAIECRDASTYVEARPTSRSRSGL